MRTRFLAVLLLVLAAPPATAQTGKHLALGVSLGTSMYVDKDFDSSSLDVSPAYRTSLKANHENGWSWAPKIGLGWSSHKTTSEIGGIRTDLGKLQTIPILVGAQRVYRQGPLQFGFGVAGGISINDFKLDKAARDAYQTRLGQVLSDVKVKNSLAVKPEVSAWYDLSDRFAVGAHVSYTVNHPKAETTLDGVSTSSTWNTDHTSAGVGFVVGIF